jgi:peroxiredoxin
MTIFAGESIALDFDLPDIDGEAVRLSGFRGEKNVVLIFLRGFL